MTTVLLPSQGVCTSSLDLCSLEEVLLVTTATLVASAGMSEAYGHCHFLKITHAYPTIWVSPLLGQRLWTPSGSVGSQCYSAVRNLWTFPLLRGAI